MRTQTLIVALIGSLALTSCATTTTAPTVVQPLALGAISKPNITEVNIDVVNGVWVNDPDRIVIHDKVEADLIERGYHTPGVVPAFHMKITITRFEHGNAAARLALIGLGQIHIEGMVAILDSDGRKVGEYKITKAFVAGGVIGGLTTTENVEDGFAKSVVASLATKP